MPSPSTAAPAPPAIRNHVVSIRLTPPEYLRLSQQAAADHRSLGSFARLAVLDALDGAEG